MKTKFYPDAGATEATEAKVREMLMGVAHYLSPAGHDLLVRKLKVKTQADSTAISSLAGYVAGLKYQTTRDQDRIRLAQEERNRMAALRETYVILKSALAPLARVVGL